MTCGAEAAARSLGWFDALVAPIVFFKSMIHLQGITRIDHLVDPSLAYLTCRRCTGRTRLRAEKVIRSDGDGQEYCPGRSHIDWYRDHLGCMAQDDRVIARLAQSYAPTHAERGMGKPKPRSPAEEHLHAVNTDRATFAGVCLTGSLNVLERDKPSGSHAGHELWKVRSKGGDINGIHEIGR